MSQILNDCGCCGFGFEVLRPVPLEMVIVGHTRITTNASTWVNLSALDLDGNILWQINMGLDSFGHKKRPMHVRFDTSGYIYVAWNSPYYAINNGVNDPDSELKYLQGYSGGFASASTVGGVDKFDRSGNLLWSTELPAQKAMSSGGSLWAHYGNCVDIDPTDGTVWTSTCQDVNDDYIHQLDQDSGAVIQSFGLTEFLASLPTLSYDSGGLSVVNWLRLTPGGNIWFSLTGSGSNEPFGPYKCDNTGAITDAYRYTFGPIIPAGNFIIPCYSILVMGEDDIVFGGGHIDMTSSDTPQNRDIIQRWDVAANTQTWARNPTDHGYTWHIIGRYNFQNYRAYWIDGNLARFVYGTVIDMIDSTRHGHTVFHLDGSGAAQYSSTWRDSTTPFTDPRDYIKFPACIACLDDYTFAAGDRSDFNATEGTESALVVSLATNSGNKVWWSDLDVAATAVGFCFCIAAFKGQ